MEANATGRARDKDLPVLDRLTQCFERGPLELGELVEQQHATMREARLARSEPRPTADDRRGRRAVVRRAERRVADQRVLRINEARDRVNARDLEGLFLLEWRQDPRQAASEHRLADARWTAEQHVVTSG